jgi:hypothetical protein
MAVVAGVLRHAVPEGHPANGPGQPVGLLIPALDADDIRARLADGETIYVVKRAR